MSYSRPSSSRLIEEVLDAADQLDDNSDSHPGGLAPTSRTSVTKVVSIVSSFNEYKRFLVNEIGWGGILKLPALARLNLRFSKWWMSRLDGPSMSVHLNATKRLRFWPGDVHKVFGVPCGPKNILGPDGQCSETTIQFLRSVLGMPKKGNQVLKAAESNLTRPLSEHCSSNLEKDCFKMAFVIFVIGHLLAPSNKHDTSIIDYWGEIANTDRIADFDWCNYVLSDLISASQQVQSDMRNNKLKTHLQGCHVFLQVFVLDNLNLGINNIPHDTYPRVASFDDNKLRRMILATTSTDKLTWDYSCAPIRSPHDNCYTRSTFDLAAENLSRTMPQRNQSPTPTLRPTIPISTSLSLKTPRTPTTPAVPHTTVHDFANYMKSNYPHIVSSDIGILLRRNNAIVTREATSLRSSILRENTTFLDKLMSLLSSSCICCSIRSLPCIMQSSPPMSTTHQNLALSGRKLDMSDSEGETSSSTSKVPFLNRTTQDSVPTTHSKKRPRINSLQANSVTPPSFATTSNKPSTLQLAKTWADTIACGVLMFNDDQNIPDGAVTFAQLSDQLPTKSASRHLKYATDHWTARAYQPKLSIDSLASVEQFMNKLSEDVARRPWVRHDYPRFISINGSSIRDQLVGDTPLDHEVCSLIVRTIVINDNIFLYPSGGFWRIFFEPDLSTCILAGENLWEVRSIQNQFLSQRASTHLSNCKMFIMPATLQTGWCAYAWDMERKLIHILNPCADSAQYSSVNTTHDCIAEKLHVGLYSCLFKFFNTWHVDCLNWKKVYDILASEVFTKDESDLAMIQMACSFNGVGVSEMLNKVNVRIQKINLVADVAKLIHNAGEPPVELHAIVS
ncbi:uncharacterized protein LOC119267055 isoform X1 [Triticum dicoccoides]|uniref:uncharacterized protein LOC119267055 isoform X1 n=1 Tax=Triticum dicoccoides TaxID=85692 RepID=UPI0018904131|nr:uncharacterized protein LOC119267055 isoform X1 [Triticum dicoccoides]